MNDIVKSLNHWADGMAKAADVVAEMGAHVEIVDGNRAISETCREAAAKLTAVTSEAAEQRTRADSLLAAMDSLRDRLREALGAMIQSVDESLCRHPGESSFAAKAARMGRDALRDLLAAAPAPSSSGAPAPADNQREAAIEAAIENVIEAITYGSAENTIKACPELAAARAELLALLRAAPPAPAVDPEPKLRQLASEVCSIVAAVEFQVDRGDEPSRSDFASLFDAADALRDELSAIRRTWKTKPEGGEPKAAPAAESAS